MRLTCTVNGTAREVDGLWEGESLLYVLRERLALPGSKNACEQGECGSCSVYLDGVLVCSCLVAAGQAEGREVVTVEGLAAEDELHPVQEAFLEAGAVQCGFCTPGLIVATHDLLARNAVAVRRRDPRGAGRQPVPLHGLREDPRRGAAGGRAGMKIIENCAVATVAGRHVPVRLHRHRGRPDRRRRRGRRAVRGRRAHRRVGLPRHAGPHQLPSPPLPVGDPRARAERDAVRVARRAVSDVGADRRRRRARRRPRRARRAAALRLHDGVGPPLRLPARRGRPAGGRDRGGARAGHPLLPVPRLDGPRQVVRRAAARRGRRGPRRDPRRLLGGDRPLARSLAGRDGADRAGAVLAVQRHARADARDGGAGPRARRAAAHAHGRDRSRRRRTAWSCSACGRSSTSRSSAGSATTSGSRTACTSTTHEVARFGETGTGVAHCPSSNARLGAGIAPVASLLRAGAPVGLGVDGAASNEAGELGGELRQALLLARLAGGPAAMTPGGGAGPGTLPRRALPRLATTSSGR